MIRMKSALALAKFVLWTFALLLQEVTSCFEIARAQLSPNLPANSEQGTPPVGKGPDRGIDRAGTNNTPPVDGKPGRGLDDAGTHHRPAPAGTRSSLCQETETHFTPLLPVTDSGFSGATLTGHPTFWFYVPYQTSSVRSGKFSIEDREGNTLYRTTFRLPNTPGFVSVSLPTTEKPLEKNKQYRWTFALYCATPGSSESPPVFHAGTVQRVDMPALETQLRTATLEERINLYIRNGIWYDAPSDLVKIRTLPLAWRNLLKAVGLEQLEREAIAGSVVPIERGVPGTR